MEYLPLVIEELGGGVGAMALCGLAFLFWQERKGRIEDRRANEARWDEHTKGQIQREVDLQVTLARLLDAFKGGR